MSDYPTADDTITIDMMNKSPLYIETTARLDELNRLKQIYASPGNITERYFITVIDKRIKEIEGDHEH